MNAIEIKARDLMPGDVIITQFGGAFYEFEVDFDGVTHWAPEGDRPARVRAAHSGDTGVFWFDSDEPVIIRDFKIGLFPLADIRQRRYASNPELERHFQMAGAVDQARVERLARLWRNGARAVTATRLGLKFLGREIVTQSAITDAERDVYRNSNQY